MTYDKKANYAKSCFALYFVLFWELCPKAESSKAVYIGEGIWDSSPWLCFVLYKSVINMRLAIP